MKLIRLCYRKIIDINSLAAWDKVVFDNTHLEFYMQAQRMDPEGKFQTFQQLIENVPNADKLHYLTSTAAINYIRQLKDEIPDITNAYGKLCLPFKDFKFEIIQSHIENRMEHKIAIWFYSEPLTWIDTVGDKLLVAYGDQCEALRSGVLVEAEMISLVPYLSISHILTSSQNL